MKIYYWLVIPAAKRKEDSSKMSLFLKECTIGENEQCTIRDLDIAWKRFYKLKNRGPRTINGVMRELKKLGMFIDFGIVRGLTINAIVIETRETMAKKKRRGYDKEKYQKYLASREWWERRQQVMKRAKGMCERCKKNEAVMVHHLTYIRVYNELLTDLQAVCEPCHQYIHAISNIDPCKE